MIQNRHPTCDLGIGSQVQAITAVVECVAAVERGSFPVFDWLLHFSCWKELTCREFEKFQMNVHDNNLNRW